MNADKWKLGVAVFRFFEIDTSCSNFSGPRQIPIRSPDVGYSGTLLRVRVAD